MASYLDIYSAVKRGVGYVPDLAVELYESEELLEDALDVLCRASVLKRVEHGGRLIFDLETDARDEASATKKARNGGIELRREVPGSRARVTVVPSR